jgi:hypothetical protein
MAWLSIVLSALAAAAPAALPQVLELVKDNPQATLYVMLAVNVLGALAKSPMSSKPK